MIIEQESNKQGAWYDLDRVLLTPSTMSQPEYQPCQELKEGLFSTPVLCIGAGGLGCELLKNLALSGFQDIHVIDLDTIDVTNLNRQFLFRKVDVGKGKAEIAANFIMRRVPGCSVKHYKQKIQEFPNRFYEQFPVIIAGLDNVEARRWINRVVHTLVQRDKDGNVVPETMHYLIDGGTEGLNGQARVIAPYKSACYECTISQLPKQTQFQMCTIANTPRLPEHCIAYAYEILWPKTFERNVDKDSYEDLQWIFNEARKRGEEFGIQGVTHKLTLGVVKNIIPAIASTNAIIAASCVTELFKILTGNGQIMDNYFKWIGQAEYQGINTSIISQQRIENCCVCQIPQLSITLSKSDKLINLLNQLNQKYQLSAPTLSTDSKQILVTQITALQEHHQFKSELTFEELIAQGFIKPGDKINCLDSELVNGIEITLTIQD